MQTQCLPLSLSLSFLSFHIIPFLLQSTFRSSSSHHPVNSQGTLPLDMDSITLDLSCSPSYLLSYTISIHLCHPPTGRSNLYQGTYNKPTFLRSRAGNINQWNSHPTKIKPDSNTYYHANHHNSRRLDTNAKTVTAKTICLNQNQVNL